MLGLFLVAAGFGVRIHSEPLVSLFTRENFENYCEIEFFSGRKLAGRLVSESSDAVEITMGTGTAFFKKDEIKSRHLLDSKAVAAGTYRDILLRETRPEHPLISMNYEDSIFYTAEKRFTLLFSGAAAKFHKERESWNPLNSSSLEHDPAPQMDMDFLAHKGLPAAVIPSSAVRGLAAENNQEQDYTALLQAGLEQLRNSAK